MPSCDQDLVAIGPIPDGSYPLPSTLAAPTAATGPSEPRIWRNSQLETLPPEIRILILSQMPINALSALVRASPVFHQSYRCYRYSILCSSLAETLGDILPDAVAVSVADTDEPLAPVLARYRRYRSKGVGVIQDKEFSSKRARDIAAFYIRTISPLVLSYSQWAQEHHPEGTQSETLSRSETIRITRALYRFQLYCLVFGGGPASRTSTAQKIPTPWQIGMFLEEIYHPWEIEEIVCIWSFAGHTYGQTLRDIYSKSRRRSAAADPEEAMGSGEAGPAATMDIDEVVKRYRILESDSTVNVALKGIIERGLELLLSVLVQRSRTRHGDLFTTIRTNLVRPAANAIPSDPFWEDDPILERWSVFRTPRDTLQRRRVPLPFTGDGDATGPPLAWTIMWRGTYSNVWGSYIQEHMRRWGHVMWDGGRVQKVAIDPGDTGIIRLQRVCRSRCDYRDVIEDLVF